ncbi:amino acid ABC transporter ATP-binding protein [Candidatus Odyssella thessalonicensis]|uniref:amino acid ABC transporter ATP-binding protein n=1 Tax=Candidatus Odyssella thessalonicensis TaxID=84647 RepID=UPI000225BEAA|nr:amino acid ABC transporter ATP-binding protein [Candidatus Odyssella thessalonicensis]
MLKISNLTLTANGSQILDHINCSFNAGEITALLGPSGSGKTSLMRCIARLEPTDPGCITMQGRAIQSLKPTEIGMVFQQFHLFPHMTVLENLCYSPEKLELMTDLTCHPKAMEMLKQFGLEDKANMQPHLLSGGQRQRVAIARALMMEPRILLFDEPTSALDPEMVEDVAKLISTLKSPERIVIMATHELKICRMIADRVLFLEQGKVLEDTTAQEFFSAPKSERARSFIQRLS